MYVYPGSEDTSYDSRLVKVMLVPVLGAIDDLLYMHESNMNCKSKIRQNCVFGTYDCTLDLNIVWYR